MFDFEFDLLPELCDEPTFQLQKILSVSSSVEISPAQNKFVQVDKKVGKWKPGVNFTDILHQSFYEPRSQKHKNMVKQ